ncbi:SubName: Full=Uncharacterized protein {ECO:0000313/EMBL:CCA69006.1} [Serendipita indica DSM 11827]|nr:SubName: Full=Uncharacterized protein {ECO:0000313/EMBL:CCA69006.1} [Serendipita indica DSM 11827]
MSALELAPQAAFTTWTFPVLHSTSMMSSPAARPQSTLTSPSLPSTVARTRPAATATATTAGTAKMESSFSYELPMDWRPAQGFDYQPYPSPFPSPAPSYVSNRLHHGPPGAPTGPQQTNNPGPASPTLSSTASSPHHHAHSHSASIDPSLQEGYAHPGWSQQQAQQAQQQSPSTAQSPLVAHQPHPTPASYASPTSTAKPASNMTRQELEQELARLKTRVNELEVIHHWLELKGMRIEPDVQRSAGQQQQQPHHAHHAHHHSMQSPTVQHHHHQPPHHAAHTQQHQQQQSPPVAMGGVAPSEDFAASWRARTDARIKRFCALNRAGNALCAWHDSRRERRTYPPRQAPPGYLNCGCTNEEALFEESLARHGVGSYHPGEMVRMDPALRNPLLKLLQARFGYVDGDFERDAVTGQWVDGEGPELWENILPSGKPPVSGGRKRGETK